MFDCSMFSDFDISVIAKTDNCLFRKTEDGWKKAEMDILDTDFSLYTSQENGRFSIELNQGLGNTIAKANLMVIQGFNELNAIAYFFANIESFQTNI